MSRIIVTGAAGFIGSHLCEKLINEGHEVWGIDDRSGGQWSVPFVVENIVDCRNVEEIDHIFKLVKPEIVFHLACNAAENKAQFSPIDITSRNYSAFINTLTPFIKYGGKRFVFTSSIAVYGALQTPFKETDKPEPEDLYGITKLAAEQTLKVMSKVHGFEYVIARPHNVYGPRQNMKDPYRNVVTIWMNKLLRGEPLPIYGDGNQIRCFSYISDVIEALYKCGFDDVAGRTFNIGSDVPYTLNQLSDFLGTGKGGVLHLPDRPQEVKVAVADHTLCKELLGYEETPLRKGINKTWEWAKKQGPQDPVYTELEIDSPLVPENWRTP